MAKSGDGFIGTQVADASCVGQGGSASRLVVQILRDRHGDEFPCLMGGYDTTVGFRTQAKSPRVGAFSGNLMMPPAEGSIIQFSLFLLCTGTPRRAHSVGVLRQAVWGLAGSRAWYLGITGGRRRTHSVGRGSTSVLLDGIAARRLRLGDIPFVDKLCDLVAVTGL